MGARLIINWDPSPFLPQPCPLLPSIPSILPILLTPSKFPSKCHQPKKKPQPLKRASIVDVDVDELRALERIKEKKRKAEDHIERLVEKKRRLDEETVEIRKDRPEGYGAQALSTLHRKEIAPAQRCLTQVEATIYHFPVVVSSI